MIAILINRSGTVNKRELYDSFEELEKQTKFTLSQIERIKAEMGKVIEKNA